jgi:hypothetical protein
MQAKDITIWHRLYLMNGEETDISIQPWSFGDYKDYREEWNDRIEELGADEWEVVDWPDWLPVQDDGVTEDVFDGVMQAAEAADLWSWDVGDVLAMLRDEGYDIDDSIERTLDDHVMGQWTLEEWAWHLVEEEIVGQETIEQYFSYEDFGHDVRVSGDLDLILEDQYDVDSPEYEEAYNEIVDQGDAYVGEWALMGEDPATMLGDKLVNYMDMKAFQRDLSYEYTQYGPSNNPVLWYAN